MFHCYRLDARDRRCYTPIHCACQAGNNDVVKTLIDGGSDVNSRAYAGYTPLHVTVSE
jgi:ankyrin repeat protein